MTFREKSAWASLGTTVVVFVPYFIHLYSLTLEGQLEAGDAIGSFIAAVAAQVVLQVVLHIWFAIRGQVETPDERDAAIELKAVRAGYYVFAVTCMSLVLVVMTFGAAPEASRRWLAPVAVSQAMLLCFVSAEVARYARQVVGYRRGG